MRSSQSQPCGEASADAEVFAGLTAWLIEETWSGHVHYVRRDFNCARWAENCRKNEWSRSYGALPRYDITIVTKNIDEAMRFPTKEAAEVWLAFQPRWMSHGGQYQVREHERVTTPRPAYIGEAAMPHGNSGNTTQSVPTTARTEGE